MTALGAACRRGTQRLMVVLRMPAPPLCPDCSSATARPIVYGYPGAALAQRAERGQLVLGGCLVTDNDPRWMCPSCRARFGHADEPPGELPHRTPDAWAALLPTMLPQPVRTNAAGELLGGDPVLVIVRVEPTAIHILEPDLRWDEQGAEVLLSQAFAKVPLGTTAPRVAELIRIAWGRRISSYVWCSRCHRSSEPEHHYGREICRGCREL